MSKLSIFLISFLFSQIILWFIAKQILRVVDKYEQANMKYASSLPAAISSITNITLSLILSLLSGVAAILVFYE
jgi:hypothetical protein